MNKKPVRILWNVFGTLAALVYPTMANVLQFVFPRSKTLAWNLFLLEVLLLALLIVLPLLAMRKNLHFYLVPLYASVVGFLISARMTPIVLPFFSDTTRYGSGFGGEPLQTALLELFVALPFAFAALLAAIPLTSIYRKKKQAELPARSPKKRRFSAKRKPSEWLNKQDPHEKE